MVQEQKNPEVPSELVDGLNTEQQEAVRALLGPLAVIAGPGSGKTRVLTHRIAALVRTGLAGWRDVLAVTFTNKAANEMRERITSLLGEEAAERMWILTFHSFCARMLRIEAEAAGLPRAYSILDPGDVRSVLREVHRELGLRDDAGEIRDSARLISRIKNGAGGEQDRRTAQILEAYRLRLQRLGALDFDDLLLRALELLENDEAVRQRWQQRFRFVLIDEYQDTNPVQYRIVGLLAGAHRNLCVVGDADQAIYGFRAATPAALISFTEEWPDAKVVLLEENYRSTPEILALCQHIIDGNDALIRPRLRTGNPAGDLPRLVVCSDDREEASFVAREIARRGKAGESAVLFRTNAQTRAFEDALMQQGVPYTVVGALRFYERAEIKDALSYLKLVTNPLDVLALARAVAVPKRGLGPKAVETLVDVADGGNLLEAITTGLEQGSLNRGKDAWRAFAANLEEITNAARTDGPAAAIRLILAAGVEEHYRTSGEENAAERQENLDELVNAAVQFEMQKRGRVEEDTGEIIDPWRLSELFLEQVALVSGTDETQDGPGVLALLTAHASKGKEFEEVYVVGVEENIFPHGRNGEATNEAEERRLLFVACSRAEKLLTLTRAERRFVHGQMRNNEESRFLDGAQHLLELENRTTARLGAAGNWRSRPAERRSEQWGRPGPAKRAAVSAPGPRLDAASVTAGARVKHNAFGEGEVREIRGAGEDAIVTIRFTSGGERQFKLALAPLTLL